MLENSLVLFFSRRVYKAGRGGQGKTGPLVDMSHFFTASFRPECEIKYLAALNTTEQSLNIDITGENNTINDLNEELAQMTADDDGLMLATCQGELQGQEQLKLNLEAQRDERGQKQREQVLIMFLSIYPNAVRNYVGQSVYLV